VNEKKQKNVALHARATAVPKLFETRRFLPLFFKKEAL
jgi:hypothetical protein